jgi:FkbM family methyltransferase
MARRIHSTFAPLYNKAITRFPFLAPIYRRTLKREIRPPFRRRFAADRLHEAIKHEFGNKRGRIFFEAGANDGLLFSNTAYLEFYCGWSGLLVEALPHKFVECVRNRPHSIVVHCALVPPDFTRDHVEIRYCDLMSYAPDIAEIDQLQQIADQVSYLLESDLSAQMFLAPAKTLTNLLAEHDFRHIDLMVLDLEGAELAALRGMDFARCTVDAILIEVHDIERTDAILSQHGFCHRVQLARRDYLYRNT